MPSPQSQIILETLDDKGALCCIYSLFHLTYICAVIYNAQITNRGCAFMSLTIQSGEDRDKYRSNNLTNKCKAVPMHVERGLFIIEVTAAHGRQLNLKLEMKYDKLLY